MIWTTPFVTADGWVWFQDIDYKLYRMKTDGSQLSTPGNAAKYTTDLVPLVTADGWVWFCGNNGKGNNDALYRMRTDGSQKSTPGNNKTNSSPFVTADGWVWFQGANDGLNRMRTDGSEKTIIDNSSTLSTPVVGPMSIYYGVAGEWVYWRGTDDKLWRDLVPASALRTEAGQPHITFSRRPTRLRATRAATAALLSSTPVAARRAQLPRPASRSRRGRRSVLAAEGSESTTRHPGLKLTPPR